MVLNLEDRFDAAKPWLERGVRLTEGAAEARDASLLQYRFNALAMLGDE